MPRLLTLATLLALGACSNAAPGAGTPPAVLARAESTITATQIRDRIAFLADDALRGRDTPSPGLDSAAGWIARELEAMGLRPAAGDGRWVQRYPYPLEALDAREARVEIRGGATHTLEYGSEFFVETGATPPHPVGVAYVGNGRLLERPPAGALRDSAVLVLLDGLPQADRGGARLPWEARQVVAMARARAEEAGAAALIFVLDERVTPDQVAALAATGPAVRTLGGADPREPPLFFVRRPGALRMFRMAGLDGAEQLRRGDLDRPVPLPGVTLRLAAPLGRLDDATAPNVVAVLPGSDPVLRDTYVVLSAHMDHVGVGEPVGGDSIYNGADDNASGTAAVLEVARAFASLPEPPRRSVLFLAVSGEEKGLLGSRWFVENPSVPLDAVVANINLDMVARNAPDTIVVIGQEYSSLGERVRELAAAHPGLGLTVAEDPWPEQRFFFRSDHFSFAARDIPALFFFAGTHEDYHRPGDEVDRIDPDKAARVARLVFLLAHAVADDPEAPRWDARARERVRRVSRQ